eukprot:4137681-Prorocentrum_lima.AAC.1
MPEAGVQQTDHLNEVTLSPKSGRNCIRQIPIPPNPTLSHSHILTSPRGLAKAHETNRRR